MPKTAASQEEQSRAERGAQRQEPRILNVIDGKPAREAKAGPGGTEPLGDPELKAVEQRVVKG